MNKELFCIGSQKINHNDLKAAEAVTMSLVAVLAVAVGTIYGSLLF